MLAQTRIENHKFDITFIILWKFNLFMVIYSRFELQKTLGFLVFSEVKNGIIGQKWFNEGF